MVESVVERALRERNEYLEEENLELQEKLRNAEEEIRHLRGLVISA